MKDYYQILGMHQAASQTEIKLAFRRLAVSYHPDKNHDPLAEEHFKEINEAYEILSDPVKRSQYDLLLANPEETAVKPHRDPAYRPRAHSQPYTTTSHQTSRELMAEYLPKFRWSCWFGLALTLLLAIDFLLPYVESKQEIKEIYQVYRTGRYGGSIYDHDILVTEQGLEIQLYNKDLAQFQDQPWIVVQQSLLLSKVIWASTPTGDYKIRGASIYSTLSFIPVILFVTSLLGVSIRKSIEFPFNLSIVSFLFSIIVLYLTIK